MADANLGYQEPGTIDKLLDAESLTVGVDTVFRERIQIAGTGATDLAPVSATDGLLVNLGSNNDVTVTGTVTANLSATDNAVLDDIAADTEAIKTAVEILDNTVSGSEMQVDVVTSALPTGAATSANQTTIIGHVDGIEGLLTTIDADTGNISTKIDTLAGAVSGTEFQVDVLTLPAIPAGTNNIGDVDVLSIAAGDNNIGNVDLASAIPSGTNAIGRVGHDITAIAHGVKTITSAGTDEALAGSTVCKKVVVQAQTDNTSLIAVGSSGVDATVATGTGVILYPGDSFELEIDNLADVFIDSLVNGEGVRYSYFT